MSIWGKLVGGAAGLALGGGPLGALLGALAGHYAYDKPRADAKAKTGADSPRDESTQQIAFTIGVIALCAKMAKADGRVTGDEIAAFQEVFQVPPHELENVRRVFNLARQDTAGYEAYAKQIAKLFKNKPQVLEDLLDGLFHIAKADKSFHHKEYEFLRNVAEIFGFSDAEFERIRASHFGTEADDPYVVIGVDRAASDDEIKRAYHKMVKENHPDALRARGVPDEFLKMANDKLAAINSAYDRIAKARGIH